MGSARGDTAATAADIAYKMGNTSMVDLRSLYTYRTGYFAKLDGRNLPDPSR